MVVVGLGVFGGRRDFLSSSLTPRTASSLKVKGKFLQEKRVLENRWF